MHPLHSPQWHCSKAVAAAALAGYLFLPISVTAHEEVSEAALVIRVVDVGAGLCVVGAIPGGKYFVYDTGGWRGSHCSKAVDKIVRGEWIDILILSHEDADHIGGTASILSTRKPRVIYHTGQERDTHTWCKATEAINARVKQGTELIRADALQLGDSIELGPASLRFLAGWHYNEFDEVRKRNEARNVVSIVVQVAFGAHKVLLTGDTVGRRLTDTDDACAAAEQWMVNTYGKGLQSNVLIAPHHGANNASSSCFIKKVKPTYVIFSAGHAHRHPTAATAQRYLNLRVKANNIFRTDRHDDEGRLEWDHGRIPGCKDPPGDDDIEIELPLRGPAAVRYLSDAKPPACK